MSQLGELLNHIALQSGVNVEDEGLKALLSNATISSYDIPDAIATSIKSNLLTVESAKNNPTLKNHFFATAYNGLDMELNGLMTELQLSEEVKTELLAEKSSTRRASLLAKKVKELESAKKPAGNDDVEKLTQKINELNSQMALKNTEFENQKLSIVTQYQDQTKNLLIKNMLSGYNYAAPISKEANIVTAQHLINEDISAKGLAVKLNDNNTLGIFTQDGLDYFDSTNKKVELKDYFDGVLSQHKVLTAKPGTPAPPPFTPPTPPANGKPEVNMTEFNREAVELNKQFETK